MKGIVIFLFVLFVTPGEAWTRFRIDESTQNAPRLFEENSLLEITLTFDIAAIQKDIKDKSSYHPAQLSYKDSADKSYSFPVRVKTRGHFRKNPRICDFPPLMIKFKKSNTEDTLFAKQKKVKLVTHCKQKIKIFNDYLIKEYLAYRIYNILTPWSLRARLVKVTYIDTGRKTKPHTRFGILLEHVKKFAKRMDVNVIKNQMGYHVLTRIDIHHRLMHAVFQFMIGHTDWSVPGEHNLKLVATKDRRRVFPIPYDFDLTGFVNTHYAKPDKKLADKIKSVKSRLYRGFFVPIDFFLPVFELYKNKKSAIIGLLKDHPYLRNKLKKQTIKYIEGFYKILDNRKLAKQHFIDNSRRTKR
jgi:hypothetical protein